MSSWSDRHGMWMTLNLLVTRECRKTPRDVLEELEEWLETVTTLTRVDPQERNDDAVRVLVGSTTSEGVAGLPREDKPKTRQNVESSVRRARRSSGLDQRMGSNILKVTDREFMQKLQAKICEDHLKTQSDRIQQREAEEMEREKQLILEGKIPVEAASEELMQHPVFKITQLTKKIIEDKKAKTKQPGASRCYVGAGEAAPVLGIAADQSPPDMRRSDDVVATHDLTFTEEKNQAVKYESPLVKKLRELETVDEMYTLADEIVGPLQTIRSGRHFRWK